MTTGARVGYEANLTVIVGEVDMEMKLGAGLNNGKFSKNNKKLLTTVHPVMAKYFRALHKTRPPRRLARASLQLAALKKLSTSPSCLSVYHM
jgi:hypothetical protein